MLLRSQFPDGSRMLTALHSQGRLFKVPTNQIEVIPNNSTSVMLSELNQIIADNLGIPVDELAIKSESKKQDTSNKEEVSTDTDEEVAKTTSASVNQSEIVTPKVDPSEDPIGAAKYYRSQADKLSKEAAQFRRLAEELVPTVKKVKNSV